MLIVTGAAGFIGSCLISRLNQMGYVNIISVDDFSRQDKLRNLQNKRISGLIHRAQFLDWLIENQQRISYIFHLGARTDTAEKDSRIFNELNVKYSKDLWHICAKYAIPLLYASSAATYGNGLLGYEDDHALVNQLKPLNPYGESKSEFDKWALDQRLTPPHWIGLKFFNVYGPNEDHKGRMASVIYHTFHQIQQTGKLKLFRSHKQGIEDGQQSRDFIYIKDITDICSFCMLQRPVNGIYNAGTGQARSFLDLVTNTFKALKLTPSIEFIDTPSDIRDTYQYFTEAKMSKLRVQGYPSSYTTLEDGIKDYVGRYLLHNQSY